MVQATKLPLKKRILLNMKKVNKALVNKQYIVGRATKRGLIQSEEEVDLGEEGLLLIEAREVLKIKMKKLEGEIKECESKLKLLLNGSESGFARGRSVSYKTMIRNVFDSKALKEDDHALYEKYLKSSSFKKLQIK